MLRTYPLDKEDFPENGARLFRSILWNVLRSVTYVLCFCWGITCVSWNTHNKNGGLHMWAHVNKWKETARNNTCKIKWLCINKNVIEMTKTMMCVTQECKKLVQRMWSMWNVRTYVCWMCIVFFMLFPMVNAFSHEGLTCWNPYGKSKRRREKLSQCMYIKVEKRTKQTHLVG